MMFSSKQLVRRVGAIGLFETERVTVEAPTLALAKLEAYKTHEPYLSWKLEPSGVNREGLTWREWLTAAFLLPALATDEHRSDWHAGVDPSEYRARKAAGFEGDEP